MDLSFHGVNLLCSDLSKQSSFISFLFDVEIMFDNNVRYFHLGGTRFNLIQGSSNVQSAFAAFDLGVANIADLTNFKQKFELYLYKSQMSELKTSFNSQSFEFEDPSGNFWRLIVAGNSPRVAPADTVLM